MREMRRRSLFFGAILFAASGALSADEPAVDVTDSVKQLAQAFSQAWEAGDTRAMASLFVATGDVITATGHRSEGRSEIEALFTEEHSGYMKGTRFRVEIATVQSLASGIALMDGSALLAGVKTSDGRKMPPLRHLIFAVAIQKEGIWKIQALRIVVPVPSPEQN